MYPDDEKEEELQRGYPSTEATDDDLVAWVLQYLNEAWNVSHRLANSLNRGQGGREVALCITKIEEAKHRINDVKRELHIKKFLES